MFLPFKKLNIEYGNLLLWTLYFINNESPGKWKTLSIVMQFKRPRTSIKTSIEQVFDQTLPD